jgi:glycosyltransferase involved in cell wall biosynthesis
MMTVSAGPLISVVVIGRNEGERLLRCLDSIDAVPREGFRLETLYVDSASTDGSPERAEARGVRVLRVRPERPSAALGRNAGWTAARGELVLFLDGDTLLHPDFIAAALAQMADPQVAVVWGHRRELHPERSLYNRVLDLDWVYPPGPGEFCGGDALMRRSVLQAVGGFDATLIAGEEPELCRRIRARGGVILHLDVPMTRHDLAITTFSGYWRRAFRAGHAYAEVAARFRDSPDPLWLADARRNLVRGSLLLAAPVLLLASLAWPPLFLVLLAVAAGLLLRTARRCRWKDPNPVTCLYYAIHSHFQQIPILFGQLAQRRDARRGRRRRLIEYKGAG